ncbi:hypothetical protein GQ457_04G013530 [Hibiscus cannabinus]
MSNRPEMTPDDCKSRAFDPLIKCSTRSIVVVFPIVRDIKSGTRLGFRSGRVHFRSGPFQVGFISGRVHFRSGSFQVGLFQVGSEADNWQVNSGSGRLQVGFISGRVHFRSDSFQVGPFQVGFISGRIISGRVISGRFHLMSG